MVVSNIGDCPTLVPRSESVFVTPFLSQESGTASERASCWSACWRCGGLFSDPLRSLRQTDTFLVHCNLLFAADLSAEEREEERRPFFPHVFSALGIFHFDDSHAAVIFAILSSFPPSLPPSRPLRSSSLSFLRSRKRHHFLPTVGF